MILDLHFLNELPQNPNKSRVVVVDAEVQAVVQSHVVVPDVVGVFADDVDNLDVQGLHFFRVDLA